MQLASVSKLLTCSGLKVTKNAPHRFFASRVRNVYPRKSNFVLG